MKLIIWWLALMLVFPLAFLFWWKKHWRLLIGVIIGAILLISLFLPSEIAYSIIKKELEKEGEKPQQRLETALKNISNSTINPSDSEKLILEKQIKIHREQLEEYEKKINKREATKKEKLLYNFCLRNFFDFKGQWIKKYGIEENSRPFLFCGEEFNKGLSRKNWHLDHSTIDFGDGKNNNLELLKEKLKQINERGEGEMKFPPYYFLVWLKNIDKITSSELKSELLKIVDPNKNVDLGEYEKEEKNGQEVVRTKKKIDFSKFILVATTSASNPQLSSELSEKMNRIEPSLFDKYFLIIFLVSSGLEIITFYFLARAKKKEKLAK